MALQQVAHNISSSLESDLDLLSTAVATRVMFRSELYGILNGEISVAANKADVIYLFIYFNALLPVL